MRVWAGLRILGILLLGSLASTGAARADMTGITVDGGTTLMPIPDPVFGFNFHLTLGAGDQVIHGDYITIHAIADLLVPVFSNLPAGWTATGAPSTMPGLTDVTFTYFGATIIDNSAGTQEIPLGQFIILTVDNYSTTVPPQLLTPLFWNSVASSPITGPHTVFNSNFTTPVPVPEPASVGLLAAGLLGCGVWRRVARPGRGRRSS